MLIFCNVHISSFLFAQTCDRFASKFQINLVESFAYLRFSLEIIKKNLASRQSGYADIITFVDKYVHVGRVFLFCWNGIAYGTWLSHLLQIFLKTFIFSLNFTI